ncbi:hypothetical protein [Halorubrum kocurii]|uniref:Uncharacterized protein n=1 Tax=Halorubrum kocurii JCM 14978 TaxID=1230456 RepID=M0P9Q0_9EURY|nr:hypothetical protein [Halorubrum kocurii]EMA66299.1 hypothetical protein C468_04809 [Halorubrum kocurii JCM 14978]
MTDEFLTEGLRSDRYLKALQLISQFEDEIEARLRVFDQALVDEQPELFDPETDISVKTNRSTGSALTIHRINHEMEGPKAPADRRQRLNVHLYWMSPTDYDRTDVDGALRAFGYKIKGADEADDQAVVDSTREEDWSLSTAGNPFDSNTVFYKHVGSVDELEAAQAELVDHFATFGGRYSGD